LLVRAAAEWCAVELGAGQPVPLNVRSAQLWYWLPLGVVLTTLGCWWRLRRRAGAQSEWLDPVGDDVRSRSGEHPSCSSTASIQTAEAAREAGAVRWLQWAAGTVTVLALIDTVLHLGLPLLPATQRTVNWGDRLVVRPELRQSFRWLADRAIMIAADVSPPTIPVDPGESQGGITSTATVHTQPGRAALRRGLSVLPASSPADHSPTLYTLLEHAELATLQRDLADWTVEDTLWREWVLSPWIHGAGEDIRWRRMLWEHFNPRVRRETSPAAAAEIVARQLAMRVLVASGTVSSHSIRTQWIQGVTDQEDFERLYVAALRAVGVPARVGDNGWAELHDGDKWRVAPRPFSELLAKSGSEKGASQ
jgi:hypothetical protein